jgi:hypothetical protein
MILLPDKDLTKILKKLPTNKGGIPKMPPLFIAHQYHFPENEFIRLIVSSDVVCIVNGLFFCYHGGTLGKIVPGERSGK